MFSFMQRNRGDDAVYSLEGGYAHTVEKARRRSSGGVFTPSLKEGR